MGEFPRKYPTEHAFVERSSVRPHAHFDTVAPPMPDAAQILELMTPMSARLRTGHVPEIITLERYPSFDALLAVRDRIRNLELVPKRADDVQGEYERMSGETMLRIIQDHYVPDTGMSVVREMYPTETPPDVDQHVVWIGNDATPDEEVARFIARITGASGLTIDDIILFERSRASDTPFVRVAIPQFRHIHMWSRRKTF